MPKPAGDMSFLSVPKSAAQSATPFQRPSEPDVPVPVVGEPKSLTVKLTAGDYRALRDLCVDRERETGKRATHQEIMVEALRMLLAKE